MRRDSGFPELHPKGSLLWPSPCQGLGKGFRMPEVFLPPPLTAGQLLASSYGGLPLPPQPSERRGDRRDPREWVGVGGSRPGVDSETMRPMESRFLAGGSKFQGSWKSEDPSSLPKARPSLSHAPTVLLTPSTRRLERSGPMAVSPSRLCVCLTVYVINTYAIIKMQGVAGTKHVSVQNPGTGQHRQMTGGTVTHFSKHHIPTSVKTVIILDKLVCVCIQTTLFWQVGMPPLKNMNSQTHTICPQLHAESKKAGL